MTPGSAMTPSDSQRSHQPQRRQALLISTLDELQSEVRAGLLESFTDLPPNVWDGSLYQLPKELAAGQELPSHVRYALIAAGCGFPVQQLPADLRTALLASRRTPQDLRNALHEASPRPSADASTSTASSSSSVGSKTSSSSSGSSVGSKAKSSSRPPAHGSSSSDSSKDVSARCSAWVDTFNKVCSVNDTLGLPLAMQPALPLPKQHTFMDFIEQLGCPKLAGIVARHRAYLQQVVQEWPLPGQQGCINAKEYDPKQWRAQAELQGARLTASWNSPRQAKHAPVEVDIPGVAGHMQCGMRLLFGEHWQQLPWLCKNGSAGLVMAGAAVSCNFAAPGHTIDFQTFDLFVVAPDESAHLAVLDEAHAWLDQGVPGMPGYCNDSFRSNWAWQLFPSDQAASARAMEVKGRRVGCRDESSPFSGVDPAQLKKILRLYRWPYCSPAAVVRSHSLPTSAAWFDGEEVFLDERCAWSHANRLLLADPFFDSPNHASFCWALLLQVEQLHGYGVCMPGPLTNQHMSDVVLGLVRLLMQEERVLRPGSHATRTILASPTMQKRLMQLTETGLYGAARWALLVLCHRLRLGEPERQIQVVSDTEDGAATSLATRRGWRTEQQEYSVAMDLLEIARRQHQHFTGWFMPAWDEGSEGIELGDVNTWLSGNYLNELPRVVWLAMHGLDEADAHKGAAQT